MSEYNGEFVELSEKYNLDYEFSLSDKFYLTKTPTQIKREISLDKRSAELYLSIETNLAKERKIAERAITKNKEAKEKSVHGNIFSLGRGGKERGNARQLELKKKQKISLEKARIRKMCRKLEKDKKAFFMLNYLHIMRRILNLKLLGASDGEIFNLKNSFHRAQNRNRSKAITIKVGLFGKKRQVRKLKPTTISYGIGRKIKLKKVSQIRKAVLIRAELKKALRSGTSLVRPKIPRRLMSRALKKAVNRIMMRKIHNLNFIARLHKEQMNRDVEYTRSLYRHEANRETPDWRHRLKGLSSNVDLGRQNSLSRWRSIVSEEGFNGRLV